jgi:hypothetical protein
MTTATTDWLRARNNDPYGTPRSHPFWSDVTWFQFGTYRIVLRESARATVAMLDEKHNAWYGFPTVEEAIQHAQEYSSSIDPWA